MNVLIVATKTCNHCKTLRGELDNLGVVYHVAYVEDEPEVAEQYSIRNSPNLIVDGEVKFRRQPTEKELRETLNC